MGTESWTSRSKIWLPAGDASLGEDDKFRVGEAGMAETELPVVLRIGDVSLDGLKELMAVADGSDLDIAFVESSVFFLPMPKRPRILFFFP